MARYSLSHLADAALLQGLDRLVRQDRATTADLIAHLAEVDARRLYAPAGYPSMHAWCVSELKLSEECAYKRIRVARVAREFPRVFGALADGRLTASAVVLLAGSLTPANADELLDAAEGQTRPGLEALLARQFPKPDVPTEIRALPPARGDELSPGTVQGDVTAQPAPEPAPRARLAALAPERYALQITITQATHDKLSYARALLGHAVPSGDVAQVLDRALDALVAQLEQRKFAAGARSRPARASTRPRHVPAAVRRQVWQRDGGRCTYVSDSGHRCESRTRLEFDHATPLARGGGSTPGELRLRCRAHNQLAAEQAFGAGFMQAKREAAQRARAANELVPYLRTLGFKRDEAQRGAEVGAALVDAPLEARLRAALRSLAPPSVRGGRLREG